MPVWVFFFKQRRLSTLDRGDQEEKSAVDIPAGCRCPADAGAVPRGRGAAARLRAPGGNGNGNGNPFPSVFGARR